MQRSTIITLAALMAAVTPAVVAQHPNVTLHVDPRWDECAILIDSSLTQDAWRQFTQEVGVLTYFRPLTDARPMGALRFEVAVLQWRTAVDETDAAWNDTFVHPDSGHYLTDGGPLPIPGLMFRGGITDRLDLGAYWTKNVESNYGLYGAQLQYAVVNDTSRRFAAAARLSFVSLYGPEDVDATVYGLDLLASKTLPVSGWIAVSPYVGVSTALTRSHEKSPAVDLDDETTVGVMGTVGAVAQVSAARIAIEYNVASVSALSFKVGVGF